jgi:hypothetical protein
VIGVGIRPFERMQDPTNPTKFIINYSEKAFLENLAAYEELRKQNNIKLITNKEDLSETKYMDF